MHPQLIRYGMQFAAVALSIMAKRFVQHRMCHSIVHSLALDLPTMLHIALNRLQWLLRSFLVFAIFGGWDRLQ
jgi:hypothetical protein